MVNPESRVQQSLQSVEERAEATLGFDNAFEWGGAAWLQRVQSWTSCLAQRNVQLGTRVALSLPPSFDSLAALLSIWNLGGSGFLLPSLPATELRSWLKAAQVDGAIIAQADSGWNSLEGELSWGLAGETMEDNFFASISEVLESATAFDNDKLPGWDPEREALHSLSAGTWLPPVGVTLNHKQIWAAVDSIQQSWTDHVERGCIGHLCVPSGATFVSTALGILASGDVLQLSSDPSLGHFLSTTSSLQQPLVSVTTAQCVRMWLKDPAHTELSLERIRKIWATGGEVADSLPATWNIPVHSSYKVEACGGIVSWANQSDAGVGQLLPGLLSRIERQEQRHLRPGDTRSGLLYLQGERVSFSRFSLDQSSFEVETNFPNWLPTDDWCSLDAQKQLKVEGHSEDMFVYRDRRFSMRPIEQKLREHPQIRSAVLCAVEDKTLLKAFVEVDPGAPGRILTSRHILSYIQEHFPHYMLPKFVEFRESLPRNHFGEIARWTLK